MTSVKFRWWILKNENVLKKAGDSLLLTLTILWKLRNETILHKEQISPDLAEPHKQLRISANRGYFGSRRVFNCGVFPIFLFLFSSWCFLILSCNAESLTWQWGQLQQVRSKSESRRSTTLCSLTSPLSLMEAQPNDCCSFWHMHSRGTKSLHTNFGRITTGISAPCSGLSSFQWFQVTKKKSVCVWGENTVFFGRWMGHDSCVRPECQCAVFAWSNVHLQLVEFHCVGDGSWQATTQNLPAARLTLRSRAEKDFNWRLWRL